MISRKAAAFSTAAVDLHVCDVSLLATNVTTDAVDVEKNVDADVDANNEEDALEFLDVPGNTSEAAVGEVQRDMYAFTDGETEQAPSTEVETAIGSLRTEQVIGN